MIESKTEEQKRLNNIIQQQGCHNWLNIFPLDERNYTLNKKLLGAGRQDTMF